MKKYVFFGTPQFATLILGKLCEKGFPPLCVIANPDRIAGRKKVLTPPPIKMLANEYEIPILQPERLSDIKEDIKRLNADVFVVAAYGKIISRSIFTLPSMGTLGVHPSLLPMYRGSSPIQYTIMNGDKETGVTIYCMDELIDHGPIIAQKSIPVLNATYLELEARLADLSTTMIAQLLAIESHNSFKSTSQNESKASYTRKLFDKDGFIDQITLSQAKSGKEENVANSIDRKIRAMNPEPGTWTEENGKRIKLLEARIENAKLLLTKIQVEGKKPITLPENL